MEKGGSLFDRRKRPGEAVLLAAVYGASSLSALLLPGMIGYVFFRGMGSLNPGFFTKVTSEIKGTVGIAGNLVNTLYMVVMTLLIATPLGIGAAVYLNEYAGRGRLVRLIEFSTETLAGIPSVIFGLFGYSFFGKVFGLEYTLLNGALTLSLMVLPLIVRNTQEALRTVPESYRSGALGMGAEKWYMIRTVLLPAAKQGILTGVILAVGRIVAESAALLFTAGSARILLRPGGSVSLRLERAFGKIFQSGGTLTVEMYLQMQDGNYDLAFGIGCVLLMIVFLCNGLLRLLVRRSGRM